MRTAFASLILAAGLAGAAHAQAPAAQPAPAAAPPAAPASAPAPAADPAAQAPAAAAPAPTLPTAGDAAEVLAALDNVCVPAVRGQKLDDLAKAQGFRQNRRDQTWAKPLGGQKNFSIVLFPQGSNKDVCFAELRYGPGKAEEIAKALNVWAFTRQPPLDPTANYTQPVDPDGLKRVRRSWEHVSSNQSVGLNFSTVRKPDDSQVNARYDMGTLQYQERKL
ncbi:hypothetical protein [Phenylobacterium sp.]|jgi:hypothetical protein|uniref:hypothetical protein n=1 Tax=Phenylobacterium sp. TaxID=1871053 RepID=UPI002F91CBA4